MHGRLSFRHCISAKCLIPLRHSGGGPPKDHRETMNAAFEEGVGNADGEPGEPPVGGEKEILSALLFDEQQYLTGLRDTVKRALKFFQIDPRTGRVVLTIVAKRLKVPNQIRLVLAGRYFAHKLGLTLNEKMNYREIAVEINRPPSGVSTELTDLVREGDVARDESGLYSMPCHRIDGTFRELETASTSS